MTTIEQIREDVVMHFTTACPLRLRALTEQECRTLYDSLAQEILAIADQLQPSLRTAGIAEETHRIGQIPNFFTTVAIGETAMLHALEMAYDQVLPPVDAVTA